MDGEEENVDTSSTFLVLLETLQMDKKARATDVMWD